MPDNVLATWVGAPLFCLEVPIKLIHRIRVFPLYEYASISYRRLWTVCDCSQVTKSRCKMQSEQYS